MSLDPRNASPGDWVPMEHRLWSLDQSAMPEQNEATLDRLSREHGWRCVGFQPFAVMANNRVAGYFILERPADYGSTHATEAEA